MKSSLFLTLWHRDKLYEKNQFNHISVVMKRHSPLVLIHAVTFVLTSLGAIAADFTVDGINYNVLSREDKTVRVTWASSSYQGDIVIPGTVTASDTVWTVTGIGDFAFMQEKITSIVLPPTLKSIGTAAFGYCPSLKTVKIPAATRHIGDGAFANCSAMTRIELPDSVDFLGQGAFSYTAIDSIRIPKGVSVLPSQLLEQCKSLRSVTLPEGITGIGFQAFQNTVSLKSIVLPSTLETIGNNCFAFSGLESMHIPMAMRSYGDNALTGMGALTGYTVDSSNVYFSAENGVLYSKDGRTLLSFPLACGATTFAVRAGVDSVADYAFYGSALTSIAFPESLRAIGKTSLGMNTAITSLTLPDGVVTMGPYSVFGCSGLKEITFGTSLANIGNSAFGYTDALRTVTCRGTAPAAGAVFTDATYAYGKLLVPAGAVDAYKMADGWKEFTDIQTNAVDMTAADSASVIMADGTVKVECGSNVPVAIYDVSGRCLHRGCGSVSIAADRGTVYLVRVGARSVKGLLR